MAKEKRAFTSLHLWAIRHPTDPTSSMFSRLDAEGRVGYTSPNDQNMEVAGPRIGVHVVLSINVCQAAEWSNK